MKPQAFAALLIVSLAVWALLVAVAQATTIIGPPVFQRWEDEALVPTPKGKVWVVGDSPRVYVSGRTIHWFPFSPSTLEGYPIARYLFWHELGHVWARTTERLSTRARISAILGTPWPFSDERQAMAYSYCAAGAYPIPGWWGYGYGPKPAKHQRICRLIRGLS